MGPSRQPKVPVSASPSMRAKRVSCRSFEMNGPNHSGVRQGSESAFAKAEYDTRMAKARELLAKASIDVMVVTGPENIFYLTGQQTPGYYTFQALVLPVEGAPVFVIRQLEYFNFIANTFIPDAQVYSDGDDPLQVLVNVLQQKGLNGQRIAIDK